MAYTDPMDTARTLSYLLYLLAGVGIVTALVILWRRSGGWLPSLRRRPRDLFPRTRGRLRADLASAHLRIGELKRRATRLQDERDRLRRQDAEMCQALHAAIGQHAPTGTTDAAPIQRRPQAAELAAALVQQRDRLRQEVQAARDEAGRCERERADADKQVAQIQEALESMRTEADRLRTTLARIVGRIRSRFCSLMTWAYESVDNDVMKRIEELQEGGESPEIDERNENDHGRLGP